MIEKKKHPGLGNLEQHGHDITKWHMVTDSGGRPVGTVKAPFMLVREQMEIVRSFLIAVSKQKGEERMPENDKNEKTNIVWIAGNLKADPKDFDNNTRALVDIGLKSALQVTVYTGGENNEARKEMAAKLKRFRQGDFIKLVCMLRPYGVKQDNETWKNSVSIDITQIKNEPPRRPEPKQSRFSDDDVPY